MSEWRDIWKEALVANRKFLITKNYEKSGFEDLIDQYKNDGMVYFCLAISYDFLNATQKAIENYNKAEHLFPVKHWQNVAIQFKNKISGKATVIDDQWKFFRQFHSFVYLPEEIRYKSISHISKIDSEPVEAFSSFRVSLEHALKFLLGKSSSSRIELKDIIKEAKDKYKNLSDLEIEISKVKDAGDKAIHENDYVSKYLYGNLSNYVEIMQTINDLLFENKMFGLE